MNKLLLPTAVIACAMASTSAMAVDLVNKDSRKYDVSFEDGPSTQRSSIHGSTTQSGVCSKCKLVVEGVGALEVSGKQVVVIKDGKLSIE